LHKNKGITEFASKFDREVALRVPIPVGSMSQFKHLLWNEMYLPEEVNAIFCREAERIDTKMYCQLLGEPYSVFRYVKNPTRISVD